MKSILRILVLSFCGFGVLLSFVIHAPTALVFCLLLATYALWFELGLSDDQ
jgi:hypothetical protein